MDNPIDYAMVKHLVLKDWYLQRWYLLAYFLGGVLALGIVLIANNQFWFGVGSIGLVSVLLILGCHLAFSTVIAERTEQTLAFVMSLPISVKEYTLANLLIFVPCWLVLLMAGCLLISYSPLLPDGLIPYTTIIFGTVLINICLILGVALVSESQSWTIAAFVFCGVAFQAALYASSNFPEIENSVRTAQAVWNPAAIGLISIEAVLCLVILAITFYVQSKKKDFI
jgi:ABC-2 type transport system permease protein